ncbi:adenylyltransferase/sulfurtransferase MoeZ [soil metagenome]
MISENAYERYHRQIILKGFGTTAQEKLLRAKVLVIGAGGLGCPILQYLTGAGVGTLGIVDDDIASLSDLHRQVLYNTEDIGLLKAERAAEKLKILNPDIHFIIYTERLDNQNALEIIREFDWIIDGTDNFESRYMINDACVLLQKPYVFGAVSQFQGQVAIFNHADGSTAANYRDLFPEPPKEGEVLNCAEAGVLGVLPGIIGIMQATEVIKCITNIGKPLYNKLITYNALTNDLYEVEISSSPVSREYIPADEAAFKKMNYRHFCHIHEKETLEIDGATFKSLSGRESTVIIDVREKGELPLINSFEHLQLPMSNFKNGIADIEEKTLLLFCQHGIRSLTAGNIVHEMFGSEKNVYSLKGGLVKWGKELGLHSLEQ